MIRSVHGVLKRCEWLPALARTLLLTIVFYQTGTSADTSTGDDAPVPGIVIIYSQYNPIHQKLADTISKQLSIDHEKINIQLQTLRDTTSNNDTRPDLIISIGATGVTSSLKRYPKVDNLAIVTSAEKYRPDTDSVIQRAVLYMTQPYCRQLHFLKLLNEKWRTIGYLSSEKNQVNDSAIKHCADRYDLNVYNASAARTKLIKDKLKTVLQNSDVLLAMPDSKIYNSKSVKNLLLTSYRHRKPIVAFSSNFVDAGALAAIFSDTGQIAHSANIIVNEYLDNDKRFHKYNNYPAEFNIRINKQVSRALDLSVTDNDKIKKILIELQPNSRDKLK